MELVKHAKDKLKNVYVLEGSQTLTVLRDSLKCPIKVCSPEELDSISQGGVHQGVVGVLNPFVYADYSAMIDKLAKKDSGLVVILDHVTDPQNVGAILRASDTAGVDLVILTERASSPVTGIVRKASVGASELIPVSQVVNLQQAIKKLKDIGFWVVGTALDQKAVTIYDYKFAKKTALIFGSEGEGIRELTKKECDALVMIPMFGKIDSLNVSQSVAVATHEYRRQLK